MNALPQQLPWSTTETGESLSIVTPLHRNAAELTRFEQYLQSATSGACSHSECFYIDNHCSESRFQRSRNIIRQGSEISPQLRDRAILLISQTSPATMRRIHEVLMAWHAGFDMVNVVDVTGRPADESNRAIMSAVFRLIDKPGLHSGIGTGSSMRLLSRRALRAISDSTARAHHIKELFVCRPSSESFQQHVAVGGGPALQSLNSIELP